jgi:hypothetical protein
MANLFVNPGFETGDGDGWDADPPYPDIVTSPVHSGSKAAQLDTGLIHQELDVTPETPMEISCWGAATDGGNLYIAVWDTTGSWASLVWARTQDIEPLSGTYKYYSVAFVTPAGCTRIAAGFAATSGRPYIDDVFVGIPAEESYPGGVLKRWDGSAWVPATLKVWNGSAWVAKPLHRWDGSAWLEVDTVGA